MALFRRISSGISEQIIKANLQNQLCWLSKRQYAGAYEGDGKTNATVLNRESDIGLMIDAYSTIGFTLNNGLNILGPLAIFPNTVISWNIRDVADINEDSLSLFMLMEPKIDILVVGMGETSEGSLGAQRHLLSLIRKHRIQVEVLPTETACTTFNFLNAERRFVAGALLPPKFIKDRFLDEPSTPRGLALREEDLRR